ncbi:MAG: two-component regulator propeller domain-containing protein [Anaerolineales bacterium]
MDVYVDNYNTVWAGTLGKGLNSLNAATNRVTHYFHDPENTNSIADDNIAAVIPDNKGGLWIGTFGGLSHYDPNTNIFTNYSHDPNNPASLSDNKVVSLYIDSKNNLWIGTWGGGLNQLDLNDPLHTDPKTAAFIHYNHNADDSSSLSEDFDLVYLRDWRWSSLAWHATRLESLRCRHQDLQTLHRENRAAQQCRSRHLGR